MGDVGKFLDKATGQIFTRPGDLIKNPIGVAGDILSGPAGIALGSGTLGKGGAGVMKNVAPWLGALSAARPLSNSAAPNSQDQQALSLLDLAWPLYSEMAKQGYADLPGALYQSDQLLGLNPSIPAVPIHRDPGNRGGQQAVSSGAFQSVPSGVSSAPAQSYLGALNAYQRALDESTANYDAALRGETSMLPAYIRNLVNTLAYTAGLPDPMSASAKDGGYDPYLMTQPQQEQLNQTVSSLTVQHRTAENELRAELGRRGVSGASVEAAVARLKDSFANQSAKARTEYLQNNVYQPRMAALQNLQQLLPNIWGQAMSGAANRKQIAADPTAMTGYRNAWQMMMDRGNVAAQLMQSGAGGLHNMALGYGNMGQDRYQRQLNQQQEEGAQKGMLASMLPSLLKGNIPKTTTPSAPATQPTNASPVNNVDPYFPFPVNIYGG